MTSFDRFKNLCDAHGTTPRKVGLTLGIDPGTITHWKKGDYLPKYDKRKKIADFFGVNVEWLDDGITEDEVTKERLKMRDEEKTLYSLASQADPKQLKMAIAFLKTIMEDNE